MADSWKKYGGIYNSDKYNSIGVGTMVADQVLIRQRVVTSATIAGTLTVGENAIITNNLSVGGTTNMDDDLFVNTSEYIGQKLYFNSGKDVQNNYIAYITGNSKLGSLGIGTTVPTSFLDINVSNSVTNSGLNGSTIGSTITDVLAVRNSNIKIRNIIAQNLYKSGVVVDTIGNIATLGFYKGNVDSNIATPPMSIVANTDTSTFTINSNNNTISSNANTTITSGQNTLFTSNGNTTVSSQNSLIADISANIIMTSNNSNFTLNTGNNTIINANTDLRITTGNISKINSFVSISKRSDYIPLLNGTVTIYDNSATAFLPNYYNQTSVKSGNAMSIVSNDTSSNAFINIITPSKNGLSIGGGAYPFDISRTMGTFGITQTDTSYIPTLVMVSNNSTTKYRTSLGVNTYSPDTNNYVMDINGPTRIGNGEMHIRQQINYQTNNTIFSKQYPNFGVVVGYPTIKTTVGQTSYVYSIITTNDSGINWTTLALSGSVATLDYNTLFAYPVGQNELFYITTLNSPQIGYINIGSNVTVSSSTPSISNKFSTLYASKTNTNYKVIIGSKNSSLLYYYNFTSPVNVASVSNAPITISCSNITHCDGSNNMVYFVGNGIEKIDFNSTTPVSVSYKNSTYKYDKISVYDASYAVATGSDNGNNSIISYTTDGGVNWNNANTNFNISYPYPGFNSTQSYISFKIYNIVLISSLNGMASGTITDRNGTYPLIIYTNDGSITWNKVNPKYFNTSGVGYYINNTTHSVVPTTDNNFVIVNNITNSTETPFQSGNSNILYGYIPNIFNVYTNQVVDVYGGMNVDGKVWQF